MSSVLFNLVLQKILKQSGTNRSGLVKNRRHYILDYAADVTILARYES